MSLSDVSEADVLIAGNWKMFKTVAETRAFCAAFEPPAGLDVVLCPPYTSLLAAAESGLTTYAQNVHWAEEGSFTGEISARMLRELGVQGALVGHSERRRHFGDTDETVARRAVAALDAGLSVIVCVGESDEERDAGQTELVLRLQTEALATALPSQQGLTVAYEPIWAIGTGRTASPDQAQEAHAVVKEILDVPVLYGGSVNPENAGELLAEPDVDGALVGGASLDPESFSAICEQAADIPSPR